MSTVSGPVPVTGAAGDAAGTADAAVPGGPGGAGGGAAAGTAGGAVPAARAADAVTAVRAAGAVRAWLRLLGSELGMIFRRPRNLAVLAVLAAVPVLLGLALRLFTGVDGGGGAGGGELAILGRVTGNALFLAFAALSVLVQFMLPVAVSVVAGDSVAGEAGAGTLRYLLVAPAGRARLLAVKYVGAVVFCLAAVSTVVLSALLTGLALFPVGPVTLLSGATVPFTDGLLRMGLVVLYVAAGMAALAAVSLAISTLTEVAIGAIAATVVLVVAAQVLRAIPQLADLQPYLLTHWWTGFDGVLRDPVAFGDMGRGLLVFAAYTAVAGSVAWARFTGRDVTC
ncbi:ABC transporter permease [Streptosporangium pseudovulgare]|uniref:ABC transporter permease n=1 Tax=Streptosporangium pseudovulgare TaxID=35765 RepID=A0ABQ2R1H6_9ACTN|nr:ABC transporter permease [Streptosporangium pseudovulgare]GGQ08961.1 ABC transporter permease [Streptosporangium pseudovulgare]